jgi:tetratricopeptide (TPR) repeat protein
MSDFQNIRNQQRVQAAEGYLDVLMVFADRWPPDEKFRDRLAHRALEQLDQIPADYPKWRAERAYLRGHALRTMDRYADAIGPLSEAAELQPSNIHVQLALGWCYKRTGRLDLAIQSLEEAMEAQPDEGIIHYNLACYWSLAQNKGLALQYLTQSFDLDPNYRDLVATERDFDPLRDDPDFQMLTSVSV